MSEHIVAAIGYHGFWGLSSAFDLLDLESTGDSATPLNVLLLAPGDIRHVLYTISHRHRHITSATRPIHFYILEPTMEVLCRELLLLHIAYDYEIPIRQRTNIFLEIFGNCKVQDRTARYIELLGQKLRNLVVDGKGPLESIVDLSLLKYREKDVMEEVFKSYARSYVFDIDALLDRRIRAHLTDRYDARTALFDWDWHYSVRASASIVHVRMYKDWRTTGIAFEFSDQSYSEPNRSLMSYIEGLLKKGKDSGLKKEIKGYWGDVVCSPFFALGIDCDTASDSLAEGLFEIINKNTGTEQHRHNCVEVAVFSVLAQLWEIETGAPYRMTAKNDIFSGLGSGSSSGKDKGAVVGEEIRPEDRVEELGSVDEPPPPPPVVAEDEEVGIRDVVKEQCMAAAYEGIKIFPLAGSAQAVLGKERYAGFFDSVYVSSRYAQLLNEQLLNDVLK